MRFDCCGRDEIDDQFDELDITYGLAREYIENKKSEDQLCPKYYTGIEMIMLMAEEAASGDIKQYQQSGGTWIVEINYRGIIFISNTGNTSFSDLLREGIKYIPSH